VNLGRRVGNAEGRLVAAGSGKLLAHGTSTCLVVELP
jgi:acyl-coenzyme A thioesterase PaaI-like protein